MRIVYILLAHRLPEQSVRLVRRLNTDGTTFLIHVDRTASSGIYQRIAGPLSEYANVSFLSNRYVIRKAQFGHVRAPLEAFRLIGERGLDYDYAVLLTGQDYPIKSNHEIQKALRERKGQSLIRYWSTDSPEFQNRIIYWHFFIGGLQLAFPKADMFPRRMLNRPWNVLAKMMPFRRRFPQGFTPFYGSAYWCLERESVEYIDEFARHHAGFVRFFRRVKYSSEAFFQTVLVNSPLKGRLVNDHLRFIDWSRPELGPAVLGMNDFERFMGTDRLFARKFDTTVDARVLDAIDERIK